MMKKIISLLLTALITVISAVPVMAKDITPSIIVDGREIVFRSEQPPVIQNDRLYIPVRRVIEKMGSSVAWDGEKKLVTIDSADNITRILMTIDNPQITVYTFTSVFHADKEIIESDVAPVIINDRTMLPIRVIAEALGATVLWDDDTKQTTITSRKAKILASTNNIEDVDSEEFNYAEIFKEKVPALSISCDDKDIKKGDIVTLKLKLDNIKSYAEDARLTATTLSIKYNKDAFLFTGYTPHANGEDIKEQLGVSNADFYEDCTKIITLNLPENAYVPGEDGIVMTITFRALKDGGADFAISNGITEIGYDTELLLVTDTDVLYTISDTHELYIDTTPITVK